MRTAIIGLLGGFPALSLGLIAIRGTSLDGRWAVIVATALLVLAALFASSRRGRSRTALAVFAVVGSLYLALGFGPGLDPPEVEYLPTTAALQRLFPLVVSERFVRAEAARREFCTCSVCVADVRADIRAGYLRTSLIVSALSVAAISGLAAWCFSTGSAWWRRQRATSAMHLDIPEDRRS